MAGLRPVRPAVTAVVPVTGLGEAATEVYVARVGLVLQSKPVTVDVDPTVRVPLNVAELSATEVAGSLVADTAASQLLTLPRVKVPPNAAKSATSSLAFMSLRSAMMSAAGTPAAISVS